MSISGAIEEPGAIHGPPESKEPEKPVDAILEKLLSRIRPPGISEKKKIMVFGPAGAGKSTFAGTASGNLILDSESSSTSLAPGARASVVKDDVKILTYKNWGTFEAITSRLNDKVPQLADIKVFTLDTATDLHKKGLAEKTDREWARLQQEWANAPSQIDLKKSRYKAETEEQTENNEHIRRLIGAMRDMDRDILVLCHARRIERKGAADIIQPDFSEKLANTLMSMMDIVGYLYEDEEHGRILQTKSDGIVQCKSRIVLPDKIANPTWDFISEAWDKQMASNQ